MPIYEYKCEACGKKFEVLQKFSDDPLLVHPECGGKVDKLISTSALQFKGSGWYVNDYAKGATGKPGDTKTDSKSDSGGHSDSGGDSATLKTETKTETKAESKPTASESKPAAPSSTSSSTDSK
jgi:putative FmdB family regulatory protein